MKTKNIAIIIGHDKESPGAYSKILGTSEYIYNSEVASHLGGVADIYKRPLGGGYTTQMRKLAEILNPKGYDLVVELHFNKFDGEENNVGTGCEALVYPDNEQTKIWGNHFCFQVSEKYDLINRGVKEVEKGGRGYGFLSLMSAPAMIVEPFFGDENEALKFENTAEYAQLIKEWIKCL